MAQTYFVSQIKPSYGFLQSWKSIWNDEMVPHFFVSVNPPISCFKGKNIS